jgi:hypothetical protein
LASDLAPPTSSTAIVHTREDDWFVDITGESSERVDSQVDGILYAADALRSRGGGQLLIRERGGGPYKRLVIEASRS